MLAVSLLGGLEVPVGHTEHQDRLDLNALAVPGVRKDHPRVCVRGEEDLEQLAQQLLPQQGDGWVDLKQAKHQDIWTGVLGEGEELRHLHGVTVVGQVEQGLDQIEASPGRHILVLKVWLDFEYLSC